MIPLTVPEKVKSTYQKNLAELTKKTSSYLFFVYDHRLEHLQFDFYGKNISEKAPRVTHPFSIAAKSNISAFVTYLGLISRYAEQFPYISYMVKLTGKIPIQTYTDDAHNYPLCSVDDVIHFKEQTKLNILGVACVVYLGSIYEKEMLQCAEKMIIDAHKHGLLTCLFMYICGEEIPIDDPMLVAGAAGVANVLGADFVKIHVPNVMTEEDLYKIKHAAGNTAILFSGGEKKQEKELLDRYSYWIQNGFCSGAAIGRNIFQREEKDAIELMNQIASIKMIS
jgi:fructose-bisphosphate aldolase / 6-deoxy-5-ketofructose 1-phosphate synthase